MRPVLTAAIAAALCLLSIGAAKAADTVAVIINRANLVDRLNESEIRKIYTNTTLSWPDGTPITIYDLSLQDPLRGLFSEKILGKTPDKVAEEWAHLKITNQAKNPPQAMKSESLIVRRVSREKGAIGYVSIGAVKNNQSIRIVNIIVEDN
ncbi:MAG: substrate-binding domain-containing protein [Deltaproteobacteria bacterium]|nr:substrate-binding domain-containing protein [Deltaproteobacteria bacterium]